MAVTGPPRMAEVDDDGPLVATVPRIQDHVRGGEFVVDDRVAQAVEVGDSRQQLPHQEEREGRNERELPSQPVVQRFSGDELGEQVWAPHMSQHPGRLDGRDPRMAQRFRDRDLNELPVGIEAVRGDPGRVEDLEERGIPPVVDHPVGLGVVGLLHRESYAPTRDGLAAVGEDHRHPGRSARRGYGGTGSSSDSCTTRSRTRRA